jgi:hypothetical protein
MSLYKCFTCSYKCDRYSNIVKHLTKKKKCKKNAECFNYTEEEAIKLSLLPFDDNDEQNIDNKLLKNKNKNIVTKEKLLEILCNIDKNKLKCCTICSENFSKISELKAHVILSCISIETNDKKNLINTNINGNNNSVQNADIINNTTINNTTINNNITNNISVYPLSFDDKWDTSHVSDAEKTALLISMFKFTKTLESLLENKNNQNVLIDKKNKSGLVYNNNILEKMSLDDICNKSLQKIFVHLKDFFEEVKNNNVYAIEPNLLERERKNMRIKYNQYGENPSQKREAIKAIADTLEKQKKKVLDNFTKLNLEYGIKELGF